MRLLDMWTEEDKARLQPTQKVTFRTKAYGTIEDFASSKQSHEKTGGKAVQHRLVDLGHPGSKSLYERDMKAEGLGKCRTPSRR